MYQRPADSQAIAPDMDPDPQLSPVERVQALAMGDLSKIGAARFRNMVGSAGLPPKPSNELPEGEDPAGWFIVGGQYVNCDGLTPMQIEEKEPLYFKRKLEAAKIELTQQQRASVAMADALEKARADVQDRDTRIAAYEQEQKNRATAQATVTAATK